MGKIKKIKAERKKAKIHAEIKRKKTINTTFKFSFYFLFFMLVFVGGYFGYIELDQRYGIGNKLPLIGGREQEGAISQEEKRTERRTYEAPPEFVIDVSREYYANFETNKGNFTIRLLPKEAPKTVNNFVFLSREGFYNGLTFHRVISDFMIQGGDPKGDGTGGPGYTFEDEINERKLVRGVLAMANSGPNTNGSQFFIVTAEATPWIDGRHTAFGEITEGLEVVKSIEATEVGENDRPVTPVVISKIQIIER